jgi:hypothetical protein
LIYSWSRDREACAKRLEELARALGSQPISGDTLGQSLADELRHRPEPDLTQLLPDE